MHTYRNYFDIKTRQDMRTSQYMLTQDEHENHRLVMLRYEGTHMGLGPDTIESMEWKVTSDDKGYVELKTNDEITDKQNIALNKWFNRLQFGEFYIAFSGNGFEDAAEKHIYETDLMLTDSLSPEQQSSVEWFDATESMRKYVHDKNWNDVSKTFADVRECSKNLTSAEWDVENGKVRIETMAPLAPDQMNHISNWIHDCNHREIHLGNLPFEEHDYKLTEVTEEKDDDLSLTEADLSFAHTKEKGLTL